MNKLRKRGVRMKSFHDDGAHYDSRANLNFLSQEGLRAQEQRLSSYEVPRDKHRCSGRTHDQGFTGSGTGGGSKEPSQL